MTDATNTPGDDVPLDPPAPPVPTTPPGPTVPPEPPLPPLPPDANRRYDHAGDLLPPLDADRTPAPPAISSSFGEEVPRDA
ncbi:hypothetical protein ASE16_12200 [Leifsonia sp. Root227]|uniref:hypothetical protein n=1 Tax=Leifsonia sp. Root227 TaxID=1736496 RepID=UPI0006F9A3AB|nr:hypothetical protein [Leifsonia sp. Root227]KRC49493.1 hypothetical protein ASE16_12200 [Leifsonia sp. Root227]